MHLKTAVEFSQGIQQEEEAEDLRRQKEKQEDREFFNKLIENSQTTKVSKEELQVVIDNNRKEIEQVESWIEEYHLKTEHRIGDDEKTLIDLQKAIHTNSQVSVGQSLPILDGKPMISKIINPPTFNGETHWPNNQRQFEAAAECNHCNNEEKDTALILALRGKPLSLFSNIPTEKQKDYAATVGHWRLDLGLTTYNRSHHSETLQEYGADIQTLVRLAYPDKPEQFAHQLGVSSFIDGLRNIQLQQALSLGRFADIRSQISQSAAT